MAGQFVLPELDYKPKLPSAYKPGIGIIGCGGIVKSAHLPAYQKYGIKVAGVYDINPEATRSVVEKFGVGRVYASVEELLSDPGVGVVDIATHPDQRVALIRQAVAAGKHVLAQKPLAPDARAAAEVVEEAKSKGLLVAVNQNGRWAPAWRAATLLIQQGVIGKVLAVTHLMDIQFGWVPGTPFDSLKHFAIYDYSIHWIDITRCWMDGKKLKTVRAADYRPPNQKPEGKSPWAMWTEFQYEDGANAMLRCVGGSTTTQPGHPFWVHGTRGTLRGSVLGNDRVELEKDGVVSTFQLEGQWFPDGFGGTMGELLCAIEQKREPYNSAQHNLLSLQMTLAACKSADENGRPVAPEEIPA